MYDAEMNELKKKVDKMLLPKSKEYQQGRVDERAEMLMPYDVESIDDLIKNVRNKTLDEVRNALFEKADYMETEEGFYGKVVTEKEIEEVIKELYLSNSDK